MNPPGPEPYGGETTGSAPRVRRWWVPWARGGLQLLVAALLIEFLVVPKLTGSSRSLHLLFEVRGPWLPAAVVFELASLVAFALATRAVLRRAVRPRWWTIMRIDLSTIAVSHTLPAGSATGTAVGIRLLSRAGVPVPDATFAKIAQGVVAALILQVLLWIGMATSLTSRINSPIYLFAFGAGMTLLVLVVAGIVVLRQFRAPIGRLLDQVARRLPRVPDDTGSRFIGRVGAEIDLVLTQQHRLHGAAAWSLANWLLDSLALYASVLAYGHSGFGYGEILLAFAIANILNWVPITPGGLGLVEGALIPLLIGFGAAHSVAVLGVITWRLLSFWLPIPLGALAYASLRWSQRRRDRNGRHDATVGRSRAGAPGDPDVTRDLHRRRREGA